EFVSYLEGQDRLLFWFRNAARQNYALQGWKKHKIYPDFIFTLSKDGKRVENIHVVETKGLHLMNEDTKYKESVFELCNRLAEQREDLNSLKIATIPLRYDVFSDQNWQQRINEAFSSLS
ncbi:MAG: restriction endonuclease subunit R, partial [Candidatus Gracilibacteria bacterium]|nr:restriction endonuclease subunit R [Candidatus Gracilibacteria bacterium]